MRAPLAVLVAMATLLGVPASAQAKLEFNLPAQIYLQIDDSAKTDADPGRCFVAVFAEFPKIRHAKGYEIVVQRNDLQGKPQTQYTAPPFENSGFTARYPPPKNFGRFFLLGYGTGQGCPATILGVEGKAVIVSAKVSLDKAYEKRFREADEPPYECAAPPGKKTVNLHGGSDTRKLIVRRRGIVTSTEKGSNQQINVLTNEYATTGTVITTGKNSVVKIVALNGEAVHVGPRTRVRLTDSGFEILSQPKHAIWTVPPTPDSVHKVRTCSVVSAARG